jgi:hypothetical protein
MDGVITNFNKRYIEVFNSEPHHTRDRKEFSDNWDQFVLKGQFEFLDWFPGGQELVEYAKQLKEKGYQVEILSSSGGEKYHEIVTRHKKSWLVRHGVTFTPNIVPGRKHKTAYAGPDAILIDDTFDVIESFNGAGGHGILHKSWGETKEQLEKLLAM